MQSTNTAVWSGDADTSSGPSRYTIGIVRMRSQSSERALERTDRALNQLGYRRPRDSCSHSLSKAKAHVVGYVCAYMAQQSQGGRIKPIYYNDAYPMQ